jgi:ABC-2 type transport system ATP-binding protein
LVSQAEPLIDVKNLVVDYKVGRQAHRAVNGISFHVDKGECVGFIGANGAGKSSTIKAMLGFVFPASGHINVFGQKAGTVESRRRLGYLPEVALYYPFMKARELLELYGGLQGLSKSQLGQRVPPLLDDVGLGGKGEILLKNFSKGMQQRLGIAQAIIADPELMIFDELSSGLDPVGRFDLRTVLLRLKQQGRTIFFSSHELSEVEALCDRVVMIDQGKIVTQSTVAYLMKPLNTFEIICKAQDGKDLPKELESYKPVAHAGGFKLVITGVAEYAKVMEILSLSGTSIISTSSQVQSLEDYFIKLVHGSSKIVPGLEDTAQ